MASGGARVGAGRKPKAEQFARPIAAAEKQIVDKLPEVIGALLELALGVTVEEVDKEGGVNVYRKAPDFKAASYLADRIMGKPMQPQEVSGPGGKPVQVKVDNAAQEAAAKELKAWRDAQTAQISNLLSAPPTLPTSSTTTES